MMHCERPDRHRPSLICGYPLPCPYHTVIIDTEADPPTLRIPITSEPDHALRRLKDIARAIKEGQA